MLTLFGLGILLKKWAAAFPTHCSTKGWSNKQTNKRTNKIGCPYYCTFDGRTMGRRFNSNVQIQLNLSIRIIKLMSVCTFEQCPNTKDGIHTAFFAKYSYLFNLGITNIRDSVHLGLEVIHHKGHRKFCSRFCGLYMQFLVAGIAGWTTTNNKKKRTHSDS